MYNPRTLTQNPVLKPAAIILCSIFSLLPLVSHSGAQTAPPQAQVNGNAVKPVQGTLPAPASSTTGPTGPNAPAASSTPAAPKTPVNLYDWDNSQGVNWNTALKSEQQVMAEFQAKVKQAVLKASSYPPLIGKQADKIVELAIQIDSDGTIGNIDVNNSSGHKQFDAAIILAAKRISEPLIPPHERAVTLLIVFKNSELGKAFPTKDMAKDPAAAQPPATPPVSTTPPPMQAAPANK